MCHVTHMNASSLYCCGCHFWTESYVNESCLMYEWVMAHIWMSLGTHMNESWHTYEWVLCEWVMSHVWMSHDSCLMYEWVMTHSHRTHMNESCLVYEWVRSHIRTSPVAYLNESSLYTCDCHSGKELRTIMVTHMHDFALYDWVMSNICMSHVCVCVCVCVRFCVFVCVCSRHFRLPNVAHG